MDPKTELEVKHYTMHPSHRRQENKMLNLSVFYFRHHCTLVITRYTNFLEIVYPHPHIKIMEDACPNWGTLLFGEDTVTGEETFTIQITESGEEATKSSTYYY